jgi:hypothetical protein
MARRQRLIWRPALDNDFPISMGSNRLPKINPDMRPCVISHLGRDPRIHAEHAPALSRHVEDEVVDGSRCRCPKSICDTYSRHVLQQIVFAVFVRPTASHEPDTGLFMKRCLLSRVCGQEVISTKSSCRNRISRTATLSDPEIKQHDDGRSDK